MAYMSMASLFLLLFLLFLLLLLVLLFFFLLLLILLWKVVGATDALGHLLRCFPFWSEMIPSTLRSDPLLQHPADSLHLFPGGLCLAQRRCGTATNVLLHPFVPMLYISVDVTSLFWQWIHSRGRPLNVLFQLFEEALLGHVVQGVAPAKDFVFRTR